MPFTPAPTNGDDVLTDTPGSDGFVDALAGNDQITVSGGFDSVDGGADRDRLIINYAGATQAVTTSSGRIWQGNSNFQVDFFGIEDFTVTTGGSNDTIIVYGGDDVVNLGDGDDFADFGAGNDSGDGGTGTDGFSANLGSATSAVGINLVTGVSATFSNFEYLGTLITGSGDDTIVTRAITRNEVIDTGAGDDTITVAGGFDNVTGGADRDRLIIDYAGATQAVTTSSGRIWQGNSNFQVDFSGIEDFTVTTGGSNDTITVGSGDDVVNLGGGDDVVDFGSGND
ncbi:MAG TPA: hypothetical protein VD858_19290, partial [Reyranella sp.]|nr:hypothetical protein [Reyranella sp.]